MIAIIIYLLASVAFFVVMLDLEEAYDGYLSRSRIFTLSWLSLLWPFVALLFAALRYRNWRNK